MAFHHHKPLTAMYDDNYRYGTSLYSPSVSDVERKYRNTLSLTKLRSDRGDLGLYTFAGSNLHGGTPAAEKLSGPKSSSRPNQDLYAPINTAEYGKGYYDHLRAGSPERRARTRTTYLDEEPKFPVHTDFSTHADFETEIPRSTTKTTKTTEYWVPLTTHIYRSPYHTYYYNSSPYSSHTFRTADDLYSYNYVDDFKRYATTTTTTKSKNIDALDLSITSKNYDRMEYSRNLDKCREMYSQLSEISNCVSEAETKLKNEVSVTRSKLAADLAEVSMVVEDTAKYNDELHRVIRKQAKQISGLTSQYDEMNQNILNISETLEKSRNRCLSMQSDLTSVQTGLELAMKRR